MLVAILGVIVAALGAWSLNAGRGFFAALWGIPDAATLSDLSRRLDQPPGTSAPSRP